MPIHHATTTAVLAACLLAACERGADSGATANPMAPGRPGTANPPVQVAPEPTVPARSPQVGGTPALAPAVGAASDGPATPAQPAASAAADARAAGRAGR